MQRHGRRHAHKLKDGRAVIKLLVNVARLACARKARKASAAGSDPPRRHGHAERLLALDEVFDVHLLPPQLVGQIIVIFREPRVGFLIMLADELVCDLKWCFHDVYSCVAVYLKNPPRKPPTITWERGRLARI